MIFWLSVALAAPPAFPARADVVRALLDLDPRVAEASAMLEKARADTTPPPLSPLRLELGVAPASTMMFAAEAGASWMLPAPKMRSLQARFAGTGATAAEADTAMMRLEAAARYSQLVDEVWSLAAESSLVQHHAAVLHDAVEAVNRRVAAGLATPDQRVMAEMALVEADEESLGLKRRAREAEAQLTAIAQLVEALPPAPAALLEWTHLATAPPDDPGPVLRNDAAPAGFPPSVELARARLEGMRVMDTMAHRAALPMTEVMASYSSMWDDPTMGFMLGFGVEIPLDGRVFLARQAAAAADVRAAEAQVKGAAVESTLAVARARAGVDEMRAMETLAETRMAPLTAEALRLARTAYETNRGSLVAWLTAERDDARTRQSLLRTRAQRRQMEAMLAMARGELAGLPDEPGVSR